MISKMDKDFNQLRLSLIFILIAVLKFPLGRAYRIESLPDDLNKYPGTQEDLVSKQVYRRSPVPWGSNPPPPSGGSQPPSGSGGSNTTYTQPSNYTTPPGGSQPPPPIYAYPPYSFYSYPPPPYMYPSYAPYSSYGTSGGGAGPSGTSGGSPGTGKTESVPSSQTNLLDLSLVSSLVDANKNGLAGVDGLKLLEVLNTNGNHLGISKILAGSNLLNEKHGVMDVLLNTKGKNHDLLEVLAGRGLLSDQPNILGFLLDTNGKNHDLLEVLAGDHHGILDVIANSNHGLDIMEVVAGSSVLSDGIRLDLLNELSKGKLLTDTRKLNVLKVLADDKILNDLDLKVLTGQQGNFKGNKGVLNNALGGSVLRDTNGHSKTLSSDLGLEILRLQSMFDNTNSLDNTKQKQLALDFSKHGNKNKADMLQLILNNNDHLFSSSSSNSPLSSNLVNSFEKSNINHNANTDLIKVLLAQREENKKHGKDVETKFEIEMEDSFKPNIKNTQQFQTVNVDQSTSPLKMLNVLNTETINELASSSDTKKETNIDEIEVEIDSSDGI